MRGAPNWKKPGDLVDPDWKKELLRWLGKTCDLDVLVETGTCHGATPEALYRDFHQIYTVELHHGLYAATSKRLAALKNVFFFRGDSAQFLELLWNDDCVMDPALFWLDAHAAGPTTANNGDPLPAELEIIVKHYPTSFIVIDDMCDAKLAHIAGVDKLLEGWTREYRTGEVILYRAGEYTIPPFEED